MTTDTSEPQAPGIPDVKAQARRLRSDLADRGIAISHSRALEIIARQHGFRDWNTLAAKLKAAAPTPRLPTVGEKVRGRYLGQPFTGRFHALTASSCGRMRVTIHFDAPVDVVRFASFSSFRSRVSAVIDATGRALARTSDGEPHLVLDRA